MVLGEILLRQGPRKREDRVALFDSQTGDESREVTGRKHRKYDLTFLYKEPTPRERRKK